MRSFDGLYFETGQGSEVTNGSAEGVDMVTLEARTYGLARHLRRKTGGAPGTRHASACRMREYEEDEQKYSWIVYAVCALLRWRVP